MKLVIINRQTLHFRTRIIVNGRSAILTTNQSDIHRFKKTDVSSVNLVMFFFSLSLFFTPNKFSLKGAINIL